MPRKKLAVVLGIRPDVIRASLLLNRLRAQRAHEVVFIWTGQHYSENLKDVFFHELGVAAPDVELNARGETDAELITAVITGLYPVLQKLQPEAVVFLGDTNSVMGALAAAQLNLPIVHIEGCMRSYDWRMPEEKYRTVVDHLADVIYAYFEEYRQQGTSEGLNPDHIVVTGNLIVDVLQEYYFQRQARYQALATPEFFRTRGLERGQYYLLTCHRRENVNVRRSMENILGLLAAADRKIYFPAGYRTQKALKEYDLALPKNVILVDPIGYTEMLLLMVNSRGVITDSGTVVEETCVLQVPSLQMRKATERPQVYDVGSSVKFDPDRAQDYSFKEIFRKLEGLHGQTWENPLGDGKASERIAADLLARLDREDGFRGHRRQDYHFNTNRSYREDGI